MSDVLVRATLVLSLVRIANTHCSRTHLEKIRRNTVPAGFASRFWPSAHHSITLLSYTSPDPSRTRRVQAQRTICRMVDELFSLHVETTFNPSTRTLNFRSWYPPPRRQLTKPEQCVQVSRSRAEAANLKASSSMKSASPLVRTTITTLNLSQK